MSESGRRHPAEIIQKKRDGSRLTTEEIREFVAGVVDGGFGDAQLGAFLMAVCVRGMEVAEIADLTLAMRDSGVVLDLQAIEGLKIDKHSTGGVGDKVSLILAPLVASAGVPVPMISGRGLGHTGGTLDKLASIPGYRTALSTSEFVEVLADCGYVMSGASVDLAPADQRMYSVRDVSGTVESISLITSSILSKKLAAGIDGLVMDVKVGRASFVKTHEDAQRLMESLVKVGDQAGKHVRALMTDMDTPLGYAIGNALEVRETLDALRGGGPADLMEVVYALGAEMLVLAGKATDLGAAESQLQELLADGSALRCFAKNVARQGGDPAIVEDQDLLPSAPVRREVLAPSAGYVVDIDPLAIGKVVVSLGGGRRQPTDDVDPRVGVVLRKKVGDAVAACEPWAELHAADEAILASVIPALEAALQVDSSIPEPRTCIHMRMG